MRHVNCLIYSPNFLREDYIMIMPVNEDDEDIYSQAHSMNDCTGLIPAGVDSKAQLESYEDMYDFLVPGMLYDDQDK